MILSICSSGASLEEGGGGLVAEPPSLLPELILLVK